MEANVLPVTAILVAGPNATKALRAGPTIERDDVGALVSAGRHRVISCLDAIKTKGVARSNPGNVGLKGSDASRLDLGVEVAKQMPRGLRVAVGLKVGLGPQAVLTPFELHTR